MPNRGTLTMWAYNLGDRDVDVQLTRLQPFGRDRAVDAVRLAPRTDGALIDGMSIAMPSYGAVRRAQADIAVNGGAVQRITLDFEAKEYPDRFGLGEWGPGYWRAVFGGCVRPRSAVEFAAQVKP